MSKLQYILSAKGDAQFSAEANEVSDDAHFSPMYRSGYKRQRTDSEGSENSDSDSR